MTKPVCRIALMFLIAACMALSSAEAMKISRQNPYRTFNLSGRNYGSMRWEQQHRKQSVVKTNTRKVWRRR